MPAQNINSFAKMLGVLIDGAVARRIGDRADASPRWAGLQARFAMATQLEIGFWDMGLDP